MCQSGNLIYMRPILVIDEGWPVEAERRLTAFSHRLSSVSVQVSGSTNVSALSHLASLVSNYTSFGIIFSWEHIPAPDVP